MIHARHYTLEEASELLPRVVALVERMRVARSALGDREAREALSEAGPTNGGGTPGRRGPQRASGPFSEVLSRLDPLEDLSAGWVLM